jgi:hypothetical protein
VKNNLTEYRTMTQKAVSSGTTDIKAMMAEDVSFLRPLVRSLIQNFWKRRWRKPLERKDVTGESALYRCSAPQYVKSDSW